MTDPTQALLDEVQLLSGVNGQQVASHHLTGQRDSVAVAGLLGQQVLSAAVKHPGLALCGRARRTLIIQYTFFNDAIVNTSMTLLFWLPVLFYSLYPLVFSCHFLLPAHNTVFHFHFADTFVQPTISPFISVCSQCYVSLLCSCDPPQSHFPPTLVLTSASSTSE